MEEIKELLRGEIQSEISKLEGLTVGSKEYQLTVDGVTKLADRLIEIDKFETDCWEKEVKREEAKAQVEFDQRWKQQQIDNAKAQVEFDQRLKQQQIDDAKAQAEFEQNLKTTLAEEERKDRFVRNCIAIGGIVLPSLITIWGTLKSFEFEKTGTVTTIMGRGFINKLLPKK